MLLVVAPDHIMAMKLAADHALVDADGGLMAGVRAVTRAARLAGWPRGTRVIFFDLAFWPDSAAAQTLCRDLVAAIQSGRLRIAMPDDIFDKQYRPSRRLAAQERQWRYA
jgi:hypothetical protein